MASTRRPKLRPRPRSAGVPLVLVGLGIGGVFLVLALAMVTVVVIKTRSAKSPPTPEQASSTQPAGKPDERGGATETTDGKPANEPRAGKYVPEVSEQKLQDLMDEMIKRHGEEGHRQITEEQVYAIMGTPTKRDMPVTVNKNGQVLTMYQARWIHETADYTFSTLITFVNGRFGGGIIAAKFFKPGKGGSDERPKPPEAPRPTRPAKLSKPPAELLIGTWEAEVPGDLQPNRRGVHKLRLEFNADGTCATQEFAADDSSLATAEGKWRVDKSEANNLWIMLELRIRLTAEAMAINQSQLLTFTSDDQWTTRGLLLGRECPFRRVK